MTVRILIAADDPTYSRWLQHRIESLGDTFAAVVTRPAALQRTDKRITRLDCELLVAVLDFNSTEGQDSPGIAWLRSMGRTAEATPILVVAEGGNELTAVQALRLGAQDYLPKQLLTPELLFNALHRCLVAIAPQAPGAANGLPRDLVPGYTLLQLLGESSRAQVFLAHSVRLGRNVALKVEREREADQAASLLLREYTALATLNQVHAATGLLTQQLAIKGRYDSLHDFADYLQAQWGAEEGVLLESLKLQGDTFEGVVSVFGLAEKK